MNIEQIKADREAGAQGPWHVVEDWNGEDVQGYNINNPRVEIVGCEGLLGCKGIDARRIARVPDLEDFAIEAMELLGRCLGQMECDWDVIDHDRGIGNTSIEEDKTIMAARAFLKKYTKPD